MVNHGIKITCDDVKKRTHLKEFVYEAFAKYDGLHQVHSFHQRTYAFPDQLIIENMEKFAEQVSSRFDAFHCIMIFNSDDNVVDVSMAPEPSSYQAVTVFSGPFLK